MMRGREEERRGEEKSEIVPWMRDTLSLHPSFFRWFCGKGERERERKWLG